MNRLLTILAPFIDGMCGLINLTLPRDQRGERPAKNIRLATRPAFALAA